MTVAERVRSTAKSEQTRQRIVTAALELFQSAGYDGATMRDIAKQAGVATGAAYYYFDSKDALVLEFYRLVQDATFDAVTTEILEKKDLRARVEVILRAKFKDFEPHRRWIPALVRNSMDPEHPISPFSNETREVREKAIRHFEIALAGAEVKVPKDLKPHLPRLLWMYQMGLILFWIFDRSEGQKKTMLLLEKSLAAVTGLIKLASLPLTGPLRRNVVQLIEAIGD